jgi:hypothetical protein
LVALGDRDLAGEDDHEARSDPTEGPKRFTSGKGAQTAEPTHPIVPAIANAIFAATGPAAVYPWATTAKTNSVEVTSDERTNFQQTFCREFLAANRSIDRLDSP